MELTKKEALDIVGGLSDPSKMPCYGWSLSAKRCKKGSMLSKIKDTVCSTCYARKGRYVFENVKNCHEKRYNSLNDPKWVDAMSYLLKNELFFRWFDSGDLQSVDHLIQIKDVANNTTNCNHLMFTREYTTVIKFLELGNIIPNNLVIRLSSDYMDKFPIVKIEGCNIATTTNKLDTLIGAYNCPVTYNSGLKSCNDANCRM